MGRWLWYLPIGAFVAAAGLLGLRFGWQTVSLTETDVIVAYATRYAERYAGADQSDCVADGAKAHGAWIVVRCQRPDAKIEHRYFVNRLGWLTHEDYRAPGAPMTPMDMPTKGSST